MESDVLIDAYTRLRSGPAIFEVKSVTPQNEREQARRAFAQLKEYRYLRDLPDATLWAVFSDPLAGWLADWLNREGVRVLWFKGDALGGPALGDFQAG